MLGAPRSEACSPQLELPLGAVVDPLSKRNRVERDVSGRVDLAYAGAVLANPGALVVAIV